MAETLKWSHETYNAFDRGDPQRLSELRLHIQEVANFISSGNYAFLNGTKTFDKSYLVPYLKMLKDEERELEELAASSAAASTTGGNARAIFTRARPIY